MTDKLQASAQTGQLLDVFGLADRLEGQVQGLDAEPANGQHELLRGCVGCYPHYVA